MILYNTFTTQEEEAEITQAYGFGKFIEGIVVEVLEE